MSTVLRHLCKYPEIAQSLPGLTLLPEESGDVKSVISSVLEEEQETKAFEECLIVLRFTLAPGNSRSNPKELLEVLRWSTEHGDHEPINIPIRELPLMQKDLKTACYQLGCFRGSDENGYPLLKVINELRAGGVIESSIADAA